jgi:hypothetical protein
MKLYKYENYQQYLAVQKIGNQKPGVSKVWVNEQNIHWAADLLLSLHIAPRLGICHGTRFGNEQKWFRQYLPGCIVMGTEISPQLADSVPDTVCMDFHDVREEWRGRADFVYSNAFDHAFDPGKAMLAWCETLNTHGVVLLEHTTGHEGEPTALDPFRAKLEEVIAAIPGWTGNRFHCVDVVDTPFKYPNHAYSRFAVIGSSTVYV